MPTPTGVTFARLLNDWPESIVTVAESTVSTAGSLDTSVTVSGDVRTCVFPAESALYTVMPAGGPKALYVVLQHAVMRGVVTAYVAVFG